MSRMLKCAIRECNKSDFVSYFSFFAKQKRRIIISCGFERLEIKKTLFANRIFWQSHAFAQFIL